MRSKRIEILGTPIDVLSMSETLDLIGVSIKKGRKLHHGAVNAAKLVNMQRDLELFNSVVACDIINADGQSIVWASRFLGNPLPERVAGIDLMQELVEYAYGNSFRIFFFGAKEDVVSRVVSIYSEKYSPKIIAGYSNGYCYYEEEKIAKYIAETRPDILFVAITSPKKEIFLNKYKEMLQVPFIMGVGGSFDVIAGKVKRAPQWMQKYGLEWLFRLIQEPGRLWKRNLVTNILFIIYIIREKFVRIFNERKRPETVDSFKK